MSAGAIEERRLTRRRRIAAGLAVGALGLFALRALADPPDPVVHEHVPDAREDEDLGIVSQDEGDEPAAIVYDGELLPAPPGGPRESGEEPIAGGNDSASQRPSFRPDRQTDLDGQLHYQSSFNPSVAPFKRTTALNAVESHGGIPVLVLHEGTRRSEPIRGTGAPRDVPRDRFWASVVLDFRQGREAPFPSVAAGMRVLTLRTEPEGIDIGLERDSADNLTAVLRAAPRGGVPAEIRVVALVDAPRSYFATTIPEVSSDALAANIPGDALPRELHTAGLQFAREIGIDPGAPLPEVLSRLTEHFRSFEESEDHPQASADGIYLDLARSLKGVCRHRAYAFVITALALGIPTRWVQNEAHAFVEVELAGVGWMRIDLGGSAEGLEGNGDDRPVYRPREPDPLPQPEPYRRSYSQLQGPGVQNVEGFRLEGVGDVEREGGEPTDEATSATVESDGEPSALEQLFSADPIPTPQAQRPVRLMLGEQDFAPFRGHTFAVEGVAVDPDGEGAPRLRVEVYLREPRRERLIGVTVTGEDGAFHANADIPPDQPVGDYHLVVRTPGNEYFFEATAP